MALLLRPPTAPSVISSLSSSMSRGGAAMLGGQQVQGHDGSTASRRTTTMAIARLDRRFRGCHASRRVSGRRTKRPSSTGWRRQGRISLSVWPRGSERHRMEGRRATASGGELVRLGKKWWRLVRGGVGAGLREQRRRRRAAADERGDFYPIDDVFFYGPKEVIFILHQFLFQSIRT